jgi:signal transduction histidine kinase/CheY-like chemotaxis protein
MCKSVIICGVLKLLSKRNLSLPVATGIALSMLLTITALFAMGMWLFGSAESQTYISHTIKFRTTVTLVFLSAAFLFALFRPHSKLLTRLGRGAAWIVIMISTLAVIDDSLGTDFLFVIDRVFMLNRLHFAADPRIAFNTAFCFFALASAVLSIDESSLANFFSQRLTIAAGFIGLFGIATHAFKLAGFTNMVSFTVMNPYPAGTFFLLALVVFLSRPQKGLLKTVGHPGPSGAFTRRMLVAACVFPPVLSWIGIYAVETGMLSSASAWSLFALIMIVLFASLVCQSGEKMAAYEDAIYEAKLTAERANQAKTQFLANMSHEIRTPIGAIMGFTELLSKPETTPTETQSFMQIIARNSHNLLRLIDDILDLSKIEVGRISLEKAPFDFQEFLADFRSSHGLRAAEKNVRLLLEFETHVPERIETDSLRLKQILSNVVGNAIKFTDEGEVVLSICYRAPNLIFTVRDTGPGVSPEAQAKLFQSFSQADPTLTRKCGGSGLGLALSKRLSQMLGGDLVLVDSQERFGSTFAATIRPQVVEGTKIVDPRYFLNTARAEPPSQSVSAMLTGLKILIVDDSEDNRMLMANYLRSSGADVYMAEDGYVGCEKAMSLQPDVILMDIQMPRLDGHKATGRLRRSGFSKPIIALTAHAMREERERCLQAGCSDYLTKPISRDQLIEALARHQQAPENNRHESFV